MHAVPGTDYVIIGRRQTLDRPFSDLVADLGEAMRRLRAWRASGDKACGDKASAGGASVAGPMEAAS